MWSKKWASETFERAVRAAAWYVISVVSVVNHVVSHSVGWTAIGYGAGAAFGLSVLASIVGSNVGASNSPALLPEAVDPPAPRRHR